MRKISLMAFVLILSALPVKATITRANTTTSALATGNVLTNVTIPSTTAGNLLVVFTVSTSGSQSVTGITDGGDTFASSGCKGTNSSGSGTNAEIWYAATIATGRTSVAITRDNNGTNGDDAVVLEYHSSLGSGFTFDLCNQTTNLGSTSTPLGASITTTGTNDLVLGSGTAHTASATGTLANGGDTFTFISFNGNLWGELLIAAAGAHQPKWQLSGADASVSETTASFKEPSAASFSGATLAGPAKLAGPASLGGAMAVPVATTHTCSAGNSASLVTSVTCTWNVGPSAGESVACTVYGFVASLTYTVTDSASNSYTAEGAQFSYSVGSTTYSQNFYFLNLASGITTTTFNLSSTGSTFATIQCDSATHVQAGGSDGHSTGSGSSTTATAGSITTTAADWVYCGAGTQGNRTLSAGAGFTAGASIAINELSEYLVQSSAGAIAPTETLDQSQVWGIICSAFK